MIRKSGSADAISRIKDVIKDAEFEGGQVVISTLHTLLLDDVVKKNGYHNSVEWKEVASILMSSLVGYGMDNSTITKLNDSEVDSLANEIDDELRKIPYKYIFLIPIIKGLEVPKSIRIDKNVSIKSLDKEFINAYETANPSVKVERPTIFDSLEPAPRLKEKNSYFIVETTGYVNGQECKLTGHDPVYLYKLLFMMLMSRGLLVPGNLKILSSPTAYTVNVLSSDFKYATTLNRPMDEASAFNSLKLKQKISAKQFTELIVDFQNLITTMKKEENEKLRNQLCNSLYWSFEAQMNSNQRLRQVFMISAFDSFFSVDDKSNFKAKVIAHAAGTTATLVEQFEAGMRDLFKYRNSVIHGERAMVDYSFKQPDKITRELQQLDRKTTAIYDGFMNTKFKLLRQSAQLDSMRSS